MYIKKEAELPKIGKRGAEGKERPYFFEKPPWKAQRNSLKIVY